MLDEVLTELHQTDHSKVFGDENVIARILGYLECALRIRCRTIPWRTIWEINEELEVNLTKRLIFDYRYKTLKNGAFTNCKNSHQNIDTFRVIQGKVTTLIPSLVVSTNEKRKILELAKKLCSFLERRHIIPKDPEMYAHAIIELAHKKITGKFNLVTSDNPEFKTMLSTAIHYIRQKVKAAY